MNSKEILISTGNLHSNALEGKVAIITGAGGGIGYEAARALAWLGAYIIIAEINNKTGQDAAQMINFEMKREAASFFQTDISDEENISKLAVFVSEKQLEVDIVLNNATVAPIGAVKEVPIEEWDISYKVNLRGPVLLAKQFLPGMLKRKYGVIMSVSSSGAAPYMGPYEVMKVAQTELGYTIASEVEGSGVYAFTIGPGLVKTQTAIEAIERIAPLHGKSVEEFYKMSENQIISAEAAGAGFAAAVVLAHQFHGQEIGSIQALHIANIDITESARNKGINDISEGLLSEIGRVCNKVLSQLIEQYEGWKKRPLFERMWVLRDFYKHAGMSADQWLNLLKNLQNICEKGDNSGLAEKKYLLINWSII
jgi:NAD(P)-dependent dehydrogenase (short-subunit alcohol dehydrogenase family)